MANPYAPPAASTDVLPFVPDYGSHGIPAERGTRLAAHMVDGILFIPTMIPGLIAFFAMFADAADSLAAEDTSTVLAFYGLLLPVPLMLASYQWYLVATTGQSLAKRWFGIKIVRLDGSLPGFVNGVLLRSWVLHALNSVCGFVGLIDALMIFGEESRCLHDQIAGTKVIKA
jgi:uncharacterized RDD family membrane protein YckC